MVIDQVQFRGGHVVLKQEHADGGDVKNQLISISAVRDAPERSKRLAAERPEGLPAPGRRGRVGEVADGGLG